MFDINEVMNSLQGVIRAAFKRSGLSIHRVSRLTDVPYAALHRFFTDDAASMTLDTASKVCAVLGLKLVADPAAKPIQPVKRGTKAAGAAKKGGR